jgi:hypothetical protein
MAGQFFQLYAYRFIERDIVYTFRLGDVLNDCAELLNASIELALE